jgi:hypothetical protein
VPTDLSEQILRKQMYFKKTLSDSAIMVNITNTLSVAPLFASDVWLDVTSMDTAVVGLGLLNAITPVELEPLTVSFDYRFANPHEMEQGIWFVFEPVDFGRLYAFMTDLQEYVIANFKEQFQPEVILRLYPKAHYGITPYGRGFYDPPVAREFLRSTFHRLRLLRRTDRSYLDTLQNVTEKAEIAGVAKDVQYNRLFLIASAQVHAFVLGLSVLGRSTLTKTEGEWGVVPTRTSDGKVYDVKFRTLDHLQLGFILGVTPLGYGFLLPKESVYRMPTPRENPPIINVITGKARKASRSIGLTAWAYANYNKPEEMVDYHRSERTAQYDLLMADRAFIEDWVEKRIPPDEANPVRIRQYKNAVLQLVSWKAKAHAWGFGGFEAMDEAQFKAWWVDNWKQQGLRESTLLQLYEGIKPWLRTLRERKLDIGRKVRETRKRLASLSQAP